MRALLTLLLILCTFNIFSQQSFDSEVIDVGNLGLFVTNAGTVGRPNVRNDPQGDPSMEYPINSGIEHLFESGIWIGARKDGQILVSTSAQDAPSGFSTGSAGFEFTSEIGSQILTRSSLTNSDFFSFDAISHEDKIFSFSDKNVIVPGTTISINGHENPLFADVNLQSYAWNYSFADFFVIFNYEVTNSSSSSWDSVYVGIWSDMVVRNVNVATDFGAAFFNKGGYGFVDSLYANYAFDLKGDPGFTESYGSIQFLGIEWRDLFVHPSNTDILLSEGYPEVKVNSNFWIFNTTGAPPFNAPVDDVESYQKMKKGFNYTIDLRETLQDPGFPGGSTNLLSAGPLVSVEPGETFNMVFAYVAAPQIETGGIAGPDKDTPVAREQLVEHLGWAKRTYNGEDLNGNGQLDPGEDLDEDNILDRYILPEPPATPKTKIIPGEKTIEIYWDESAEFSVDPISKKMDFEGYRIYRTKPGDDLTLDLLGEANQIAQWDNPGNSVGYNNGFDAIRLNTPVYFDDDTIAYRYKYTLDQLLNGWQYMVIVTSFDEGDEELNIGSLESSFIENAFRVWPGTPGNDFENEDRTVGVYPNPYRLSAPWDGNTARTNKIIFYNLPANSEVIIYTLGGDVITKFIHESDSYNGNDIGWFDNFGGDENKRILPGGEHAWDILSESNQTITQGLYIYSVRDLSNNKVQTGKFAIMQ